MTQAVLAEQLGISDRAVSKWVTPAVPDCTAERFWLLTEPSVSSSVVVCAVSLSVPLDVLLFCVHPVQVIIAATAMLIAQANIFFCMRLTLLFVFGTP